VGPQSLAAAPLSCMDRSCAGPAHRCCRCKAKAALEALGNGRGPECRNHAGAGARGQLRGAAALPPKRGAGLRRLETRAIVPCARRGPVRGRSHLGGSECASARPAARRFHWMSAWPVPCLWRNAGSWPLQMPVPPWLRRRHLHRASDPAQGSAGACRASCSFRSHVATSTAGFELARRCRFERPQRLPGCGSRREAWRGSRRRGWRRCSGSARGLARSRGCSCRWRVA
jgi:hypothetical protein